MLLIVYSSSNESDSDSGSGGEGPSKQKKIKYGQKFKLSWLNEEQFKKWLKEGKNENYAMCQICNKEISIKSTGRLALIRHQDRNMHIKLAKSMKHQTTLTNMPAFKKCNSQQAAIKNADLHLAAFISEHNLSYNLMEHLPALLPKLCPDSEIAKKIQCSRTKCSCIVKNVIGKQNESEICEILKNTKFSLIIDESTDRACTKHLCLVVRYCHNQK